MIHTVRQTPKFMKLVRSLRPHVPPGCIVDADSVATAILERLWHATINGAPRGDIGKFDDEIIAEMCGWMGTAADLIEMLVRTGWLDKNDEHRLIVHDWHEHAPRFVKGNVSRYGGFITGEQGASLPPKNDAKDDPIGASLGGKTPAKEPPPNLTKPNLTKQKEYPSGSVPPSAAAAAKIATVEPKPKADAAIPETAHHQSIAVFCELWKNRYGQKYPFNAGKDGTSIKLILKHLGGDLDQFKLIARRYFDTDDPFVLQARHTLALLQSQLAKWLVDPTKKVGPNPRPRSAREADEEFTAQMFTDAFGESQ